MDGGKRLTKKEHFTCDMVIARFKEDLDWLRNYDKYNFRSVIVYNKGPDDSICRHNGKECKQVKLKNEGRCDHTYLYHIIHNYDTLADVTVFTKGSSDLFRETKKLAFTVKRVFETQDTVMSVTHHPIPVHVWASTFKMDMYRSSHPKNHTGPLDTEGMVMKPASLRPFGLWYEHTFPGISTTKAVYAGVFAVSKKHIHQHPKSYYEKLIKQLEGHSNPEVGHYFERAWVAVFHPIPEECLYHDIFHETVMGGGKRPKTRRRRLKRRRTRSTR